MRYNHVSWLRVLAIAIPIALLLVAFVWIFSGRYISSESTRLYEDPISGIQSIRISPARYFSLVDHEFIVTNMAAITDTMMAIRSARPYSPNHPMTHWECFLVISNASGNSYVDVNNAYGQGAILYCTTSLNGGLIYDTLRSDTIGDILETVTMQKAQ